MFLMVTVKPLLRSSSTHFVQHPQLASLYTVAMPCAPARTVASSSNGNVDRSARLVMALIIAFTSDRPRRSRALRLVVRTLDDERQVNPDAHVTVRVDLHLQRSFESLHRRSTFQLASTRAPRRAIMLTTLTVRLM